jgi:hypothetical protein
VAWPVGASRILTWDGTGRVDLSLSVDGGRTWDVLATALTGGDHRVIVPHSPSRFAQLRLERAVPRSVSATPGLFTIETSVALLSFAASLAPSGGADLSWSTDPGPLDLAGYRLERSSPGSGDWHALVGLTRATSYRDEGGSPGSRYRLFAVNGLGEELLLGEASLLPARPLAAWPLPYRGGALTVSFATAGGLGGGKGEATVQLYDLGGRLVRTLASGGFEAGYQSATWDGRDDRGATVSPGVYFIRSRTPGGTRSLRIAVVP